jgi:hypothetical protein
VRARAGVVGGVVLLVVGLVAGCTADTRTAPVVSPSFSSSPMDTPTMPVVSTPSSVTSAPATPARSSTRSTAADVPVTRSSAPASTAKSSGGGQATTGAVSSSRTRVPSTTIPGLDRPTSGPGTTTVGPVPTAGLSAQEAADRRAIAQAWLNFWNVWVDVERYPAAERRARLATVAIDPYLTGALKNMEKADARGISTYGNVAHRLYWGPVAADGEAIIGDCMDTSQFGDYDIKTNKMTTAGYERDDINGTLVRQSDGSWKVRALVSKASPC